MAWSPPSAPDRSRLSHRTRPRISHLLQAVWGDRTPAERRALALLANAIGGIGTKWGRKGPAVDVQEPESPLGEAMAPAEATARDGRRRAKGGASPIP